MTPISLRRIRAALPTRRYPLAAGGLFYSRTAAQTAAFRKNNQNEANDAFYRGGQNVH